MASLKDLRDRIASVKATQKITKAMQMVAAAKLRRAQAAVAAARPYADRLEEVMANISANLNETEMPPLMRGTGQDKKHLAVICTSDRGLCGGFNVQIIRKARVFLRALLAKGKQVQILVVGKKGAEMLKREFGALYVDKIDLSGCKTIGFEQASALADNIIARYEKQEFDVCTLFYSEFKSVISQVPRARQLVPCGSGAPKDEDADKTGGALPAAADASAAAADKAKPAGANAAVFYEYEPDAGEVVKDLVLRGLAAQIFRALLENVAGEMGAKMAAMDSATRNAGDMINGLSVTYNRRRQARITTELIEIIAGAEAL